jgi:hypothetical protein
VKGSTRVTQHSCCIRRSAGTTGVRLDKVEDLPWVHTVSSEYMRSQAGGKSHSRTVPHTA